MVISTMVEEVWVKRVCGKFRTHVSIPSPIKYPPPESGGLAVRCKTIDVFLKKIGPFFPIYIVTGM